jgi:glycosyltransferase involved in cell wall biosynthesis
VIDGQDILCFAPGPWDDIWRNRHQIMTRLARANRVLYIEPWPYLRPVVRQLKNGEVRLRDMRGPRLDQVSENLYVYRPALWAPRAARFPLKGMMQATYMALLRRVVTRLCVQKPILWLFLPDMDAFIGQFDEKLVIYHVVDEYAGYSGVSATWRPVMQAMEQQLARRADLVFVSSPILLERKRSLNARTHLIPNAVDYEAFVAASGSEPPPVDIVDLQAPIAGYVGAINEKVDLALLVEVARRSLDWSLILVGPVEVTEEESQRALQKLLAMSHVHFLGRKKVTDVPRYIAACDVCLLPYRINEWTQNIDSLKLYEYLACGKPVVATNVPAAQRFTHVVQVATSEVEFIAQMKAAVEEDDPAKMRSRRSVAAQNTWEQRVALISTAIEDRLRVLQSRGDDTKQHEREV